MALQELRSHKEAARFLGPPIKTEGQLVGNIEVGLDRSQVGFYFPVQGALHEGKLYVVATADKGDEWALRVVSLITSSPERGFTIVDNLSQEQN